MTPPPDPVAALAEALHRVWSRSGSEGATIEDEAEYLHERLTAAGWSLSHDSERRSAVIGSERSDNEALVAAIPDDPWHPRLNSSIGVKCYACGWLSIGRDGKHDPDCPWVKARAAIEGRP